jgi:proline dehydrogenase
MAWLSVGAVSVARSLLLRASRSEWLADQFRRRSAARRAVRRFMPGEELSSALDAAAAFAAEGIGTLLTNLGERVTSRGEADAVREHYLGAFDAIRSRGLPTQISVKVTHLGLDADREACMRNVLALAARAEQAGSYLWIDMEESSYVDATLDVFRQARAQHPNVGVCLQAYLRRTPADLESLLPLSPAIRLVKGAYNEPANVAFPEKRETDSAYLVLARRLLERARDGRALPVFGTHDTRMLAEIGRHADALGVSKRAYEFHMLYGIRSAEQRALAAAGATVKVLISYGENWFPWYMRRLAERPANVWFVMKNLVAF